MAKLSKSGTPRPQQRRATNKENGGVTSGRNTDGSEESDEDSRDEEQDEVLQRTEYEEDDEAAGTNQRKRGANAISEDNQKVRQVETPNGVRYNGNMQLSDVKPHSFDEIKKNCNDFLKTV